MVRRSRVARSRRYETRNASDSQAGQPFWGYRENRGFGVLFLCLKNPHLPPHLYLFRRLERITEAGKRAGGFQISKP
jgi:hypothetical protein